MKCDIDDALFVDQACYEYGFLVRDDVAYFMVAVWLLSRLLMLVPWRFNCGIMANSVDESQSLKVKTAKSLLLAKQTTFPRKSRQFSLSVLFVS